MSERFTVSREGVLERYSPPDGGEQHIVIPDSVKVIGRDVFRRCENLVSVTIPDSVREISRRAFADCSNLASVSLGNNVYYIGEEAF